MNKGNTIYRNSVFIEATALTDSNAFKIGEPIGNYRSDGKWLVKDRKGKTWQQLVKNLRNENFYEFEAQYSMPDIVQYLRDMDADYYTVMYDMIVEAVEKTFKERPVCCLREIYDYVSQHLI